MTKKDKNDISKYDSNKVVPGLIFDDDWRQKVLDNLETVNDNDCFAITKLTAGGKFVRGSYLFYNMKGVEIYTDINNIIFVDLHNNTLFIKEFAKIEKNINTKNPEDRQYIILYTDLGFNDDYQDFPLRWEAYTGRTTAYEAIKLNLAVIDIDKSIVLTDNVPLKDAITVREFINHLQNAEFVDPEEINLDDYSSSEYI
jgi:hypothetical protein